MTWMEYKPSIVPLSSKGAAGHINYMDRVQIKENVLLAPYTVFKIGGPARWFCEVKSKEELIGAVNWARDAGVPFFILGAGSNILASDRGFPGLVIKINLRNLRKSDFPGKSDFLVAEAGVSMARVVNFAIENKLSGFEWGIGIPGTIGGSVFGNAGCYGSEIKDVVESVEILDIKKSFSTAYFSRHTYSHVLSKDFEIAQLNSQDCQFGYRDSIFKKHPEWIILGATLKLAPSDPQASHAKVIEYTKKRAQTQDIGEKCAGCIFKNPIPAGASELAIAASYLIDKTGLKGRSVGKAMISPKHANYIVNNGGATADDVRALIELVKNEVQKAHGVLLEEEVRFI